MTKYLDYAALNTIIENTSQLGDKLFHASTVCKPDVVDFGEPTVHDNIARFGVMFGWRIPLQAITPTASTNNYRWTRIKNVRQVIEKLNREGRQHNLFFITDYEEIEMGIRGGEPLPSNVTRSNEIEMYVRFVVIVGLADEELAI